LGFLANCNYNPNPVQPRRWTAEALRASRRRAMLLPMHIPQIPFQATDWADVEPVAYAGEKGVAHWRTRQFGDIRVRIVDYSPDYLADHWCEKGHIILCLEGELHTELKDGRVVVLRPGMSYQVGDGSEAHRSYSANGARLFIVD
jgi:hypothetical protein